MKLTKIVIMVDVDQEKKMNSKMYSRKKCEEIIDIFRKNQHNPNKKEPKVYYILESFNWVHIGGKDHLIAIGEDVKDEIKYIVANEGLLKF